MTAQRVVSITLWSLNMLTDNNIKTAHTVFQAFMLMARLMVLLVAAEGLWTGEWLQVIAAGVMVWVIDNI